MLPTALSPTPSISPWILALASGRVEEAEMAAPILWESKLRPREFLEVGKATGLECPGGSGGAGENLRPQAPSIVWLSAAPQPSPKEVLGR